MVYNLSLTDLQEQRRLVWYSPENDVKMCVVKGKDEVRALYYSYSHLLALTTDKVVGHSPVGNNSVSVRFRPHIEIS